MGADQVFVSDEVPQLQNKRAPLDAVIDTIGNKEIVNL
jgi:hypothetical protein